MKINKDAKIPKYKQIISSIINAIKDGILEMGDKLSSINTISAEYELSRSTVEKAYADLRRQQIIESVKGKGFYVAKTDFKKNKNVLFLTNKMNHYKMHLFNALVEVLGENIKVDLEIYNGEITTFKDILDRKKNQYDYFAVLSKFRNDKLCKSECPKKVIEVLEALPKEKLIILDREIKELSNEVGQVYQDFSDSFYKILMSGLTNLRKYEKITVVYSDDTVCPYPEEIVTGMKRFCVRHQLEYGIVDKICDNTVLTTKNLYIILDELDLTNVIKKMKKENYKLGEDIGIISYNDTPLKKFLGISVIETDFQRMINAASEILLQKISKSIKVDFNFIQRNSY